jgi:2-amino-4-hydroxy-6-hydroxymethyldihydropteridine diphosphokinase
MNALAWVALGSNLGDRAAHLAFAVAALRASEGVEVVALSSLWETAPVGPPGQGPYLNAAAALRTALDPRPLLERLLAIERARGRRRSGARDEARSLDLDLLAYDSLRIEEPGLVVPHPRLAERAFVLEPLCEIAPDLVLPGLGASVAELVARVRDPAAAWRFEGGGPAAGAGEEVSWPSWR